MCQHTYVRCGLTLCLWSVTQTLCGIATTAKHVLNDEKAPFRAAAVYRVAIFMKRMYAVKLICRNQAKHDCDDAQLLCKPFYKKAVAIPTLKMECHALCGGEKETAWLCVHAGPHRRSMRCRILRRAFPALRN